MNRNVNTSEYEKLSSHELLNLVSSEFHAATRETLATVCVQLDTAHKCDVDDEEIEFALTTMKLLSEKFEEHVGKEERLLFPLLSVAKRKRSDAKELKDVAEFIEDLKEEHKWVKSQFALVRKATNDYQCDIDSFPSQKLAYAHMNNLEQDFNRSFFVEEQYIFSRILRDYQN